MFQMKIGEHTQGPLPSPGQVITCCQTSQLGWFCSRKSSFLAATRALHTPAISSLAGLRPLRRTRAVSLAGKTTEQEFKAFLVMALAGSVRSALELAHSSLCGKSCQLAFLQDVSAAVQAPAQNIHLCDAGGGLENEMHFLGERIKHLTPILLR